MDEQARALLKRILRRLPIKKIRSTLRAWDCLSADQLEELDYTRPKWLIIENLLSICEENKLRLKAVTKLDMVYHFENPNQGTWHAFKLTEAEDEAVSVDFTQFKEMFIAHLQEVIQHVSIRAKKMDDGAVWIRIAWGNNFNRPNHFRPTYVVHYLQTPYVFILNLSAKHKPLLYQALVLSARYTSVTEAHLSGRSLTALQDLLLKQYQQVFKERTLKDRNGPPSHPNIEKEHAQFAERTHYMACEAFGDGTVPKLETAVYKLETRYRGSSNNTLSDRDEPFRGMVKFTSSNLLESLRHCVSTGMTEGPVMPLLSSITQKGRNYFVITEKVPGATSQMA